MKIAIFIVLGVFTISACTIPATDIYSLNIINSPMSEEDKESIKVRERETVARTEGSLVINVKAPRYLSQPYIAYRNSPYQPHLSKYSKWQSSPANMVKEAFEEYFYSKRLFEEIRGSNYVPEDFYSLEICLKKFERYDEGKDSFGELLFDVRLYSPAGREIYHNTISKRNNLADDSFLNLAKGLSEALSEGIRETAEEIRIRLIE